jgi:hypothetical protein
VHACITMRIAVEHFCIGENPYWQEISLLLVK